MNEISDLASTVLAHLEEAQEENVPSTINTVAPVSGDPQEIYRVQHALKELVDRDYVRIAYEDLRDTRRLAPVSKEQSLVDIDAIMKWLHFNPAEGLWSWGKSPMMEIILTPNGLSKSREILSDPTFSWWWEKS